MNTRRFLGRGSRPLAVLLLAVVAPPAATLVWLGVRLLEQDRSLFVQRESERRQAAAQAAIYTLEQSLIAVERLLPEGPLPADMVRLKFSAAVVEPQPADRVLWVSGVPGLAAAETRRFADLELFEYQGSPERALVGYQQLAGSPETALRAGALLRVARVHRARGRWDGALRAYESLARIRDIAIEHVPADLAARRAACAVLEDAGRNRDLAREATALEADFAAGRWTLDRSAWELTARDIERWTRRPLAFAPQRRVFSAVADLLWDEWQQQPLARRVPITMRRVVVADDVPVTVLLRTSMAETTAIAIAPSVVRQWAQRATADPAGSERLMLHAPTGQVLAGTAPNRAASIVLRSPASQTGLPWDLVLASSSSSAAAALAGRRRLLSIGLAAILLLLAGGSYFLWRVVQRELAVARLQTDFVAAVSHEFRTPLTSLRHLTELLEEDDGMSRDRRRKFYEALGRNTDRLHRLVESLLDFARMEGGRKPYDLQPLDPRELAARVVTEFRHQAASQGFAIDLEIEPAAAVQVRADAAALSNAVWNLLDNAVKYSPERRSVHVAVRRDPAGVAIAVRDEGLGIPRHEQQEIFRRFVRGRTAASLGIKGTGLGLAMVSHIVEAHGGTVAVESEEGAGSTFRIVLPVTSQAAARAADYAHV